MASHYVVSSDNENHAESSPDPLAVSLDENRVRAAKQQQQQPQPLTSSSPSKQNRRFNAADFDLSSPTKQMLLSTPRTAGASPWRIKVTVQAEPGSDSENMESPIVKHVTHTKTTKVPLKGADASSPVKRRGRPRKSEAATKRTGTPVRKRASSKSPTSSVTRRTGTPVRKRASSKSRTSSRGDASAADVETDGTPKRKRGRPRKTAQPPDQDDIWGLARQSSVGADAGAAHVQTDATPKKRRGRPRKSIQPPANEEPTDLSRKLKARKNTPVAKEKVLIGISSCDESDGYAEEATDDLDDFEPLRPTTAEAEGVDGEDHDDTRFAFDQGVDGEDNNDTQFAFDQGATRMPDDTTIIDSENFSMISVDSLLSGGALTSPANGPMGGTPNASGHMSIENHAHLNIPSVNLQPRSSPNAGSQPSPARSHTTLPLPQKSSSSAAPPRYKTPSVEPELFVNPPPIEPARLSPTEAQTPKIGRVVKAGVALQGVLDPNRVTPEAGPSKTVDERRDQFDDLFRGFSERTRRELHAGLRLGEQLAMQNESNQPSSPALSSPIKAKTPSQSTRGYFLLTTAPQQPRLLTPEEQDDEIAHIVQPTEVEYPTLRNSDQDSHLLSPVSNPESDEDEMSWSVDTPPVQSVPQGCQQPTEVHVSHELVNTAESPDICEEEASRSSIVLGRTNEPTENAPQIQDLFDQDGPIKPARGKLPRTWRRKSSGNFQYSDEAEESQSVTPPSTESDESSTQNVDKGKGKMVQPSVPADYEKDCDNDSEGSEDSGMFFQLNMPNLFNKKRSGELRKRRTQKLDLSLLLDQSLLPESSPPPASNAPAKDKLNPFLNTPPQLAALRSSPVKSSPLRRELRSSDISSESAQQGFEESTLPMAPSSPFHTFVEGDTARSIPSDQRQLMREMATTESSLRRIRDEADEYLDAYEPQERSLNDLTEVTEPSRAWHKDSTILASSPPKQSFEDSIIRPNHTHAPLPEGGSHPKSSSSAPSQCAPEPVRSNAANKATTPVAPRIENKEPAQPQVNVPHRLYSPLPAAMRTSPPPAHPALKKLHQLPRVEPWTKTHYKALDALYQLYKKQPLAFSPTDSIHSALNTTLLTNFLNSTARNFIGTRYRAWGYNVIFTDSLIVLCAAFMQLLTLDDIAEYEEKAGKQIQIGDCGPGLIGDRIEAEKVVERLATVVLGEAVRRDEKRGKVVDKSGRLRVEWPQ